MSERDLRRRGGGGGAMQDRSPLPSVGKHALTQAVAPAQMKREDGDRSGVPVGALTTSAMPAPVQRKMEDAFDFDFSAVRVHEGGDTAALGAAAYTRGTDVHFAPGFYDPSSAKGQELLGHELAHVVQQSEGRVAATTQFKGIDVNDDGGLEREADAWGAQAARGERVSRSGGGAATTAASATQRKVIQRAPLPAHWGTFTDTHYAETATGVEMKLDFAPGADVDATSIGWAQSVRTQVNGADTVIDPSQVGRMVPGGEAGEGSRIDRVTTATNPVYGAPNVGAGDGLADTPATSGNAANPVGHAPTRAGTSSDTTTPMQAACTKPTPRWPTRPAAPAATRA